MYNELKGYFKSEGVNEEYSYAQLREEKRKKKQMNSCAKPAEELNKAPAQKPKPKKETGNTGCIPTLP